MIRIGQVFSTLLGRIVFGSIFAVLLPSAAEAACELWDLSGSWTMAQSNIKNGPVYFNLEQNGTELRGDAAYETVLSEEWGQTTLSGSVSGTVKGNKFKVYVVWSLPSYSPVRRSKGVYSGTIGSQGRLKGTSYDADNIQSHATFSGQKNFLCAESTGAASAPLVEVPYQALGRVKKSDTVPVAPLSICESARNARARNSPAAPGLERQCRRFLDTPVAPVLEP